MHITQVDSLHSPRAEGHLSAGNDYVFNWHF